MLITLPNSDFSPLGLGQVTRLRGGAPVDDLVGLWLFDSGIDGAAIASVTDASGNGHHATLMANWTAGIKRSYGMEVGTAQGSAYETDIPINPTGRALTVFFAGATMVPAAETGVFINWIGANIAEMDNPATNQSNQPHLVINHDMTFSPGRLILFNSNSGMLGTNVLTQSANQPTFQQPFVAALDINGETGTAKMHVLGASTLSHTSAAISTFYDGATDRGDFTFGPWAHNTVATASPPIGNVYAVAAYARNFSEAEAQTQMQFLRAIAAARGVTGW